MPASPAMRFSPGRELRADNHKRGRSLENGIVFKERDDDLALFNEVQSRERHDFLLQSNDDFEDTFVTKLRHFSDHKLGINIAARGESSDILNTEEEKNDYEWLITPPDTPLFPSLDNDAPQVILAQRGRPRAQPISISRSSTMEKNHRSGRGGASPNRLSPSPRSRNPTFQPRGRASSAPSSSPPPTLRPTTGSRRPSSPSSKPSTPTSRRLSTGSVSTSRGNSASPKVKAWQANIPGFSTETPPNLRTSLADRPASYVRGSSPASRNGRQSKSPTASRSISSSHSHDRDRCSYHSKGSIASSADDDVESLPSITVDGSERSNSRKVSGFRHYKAPLSQKPNRTISSTSAPKRSFDLALRQLDHKRGPQNMFRPLLSSVPSSTFYAGKPSPAWNSSVTTSSNASSDLGTSGAHDIDESELNQDDDATSGYTKVPDRKIHDEVFMIEKTDSLNEDIGNETHDISPIVQLEGLNEDLTLHSRLDDFEILAEHDNVTLVVSNDFNGMDDFLEVDSLKDMLLCSRCGCKYSVIIPTEEDIKLCANCRKSNPSLIINDTVTSFQPIMTEEDRESFNTLEPQMTLVEVEPSKIEVQPELHEVLVMDGECNFFSETSLSRPQSEEREPIQVDYQLISQPSDGGSEQIQHVIDFPNLKVNSIKGEGISIVLKRSSSIKGPLIRSGTFSASSISYDDLFYARDSTNSMRSRKSDMINYKYDVNAKHVRSASSFSGTSSHVFDPSSFGTSTLDSFEVAIPRVARDVVEVTSVGPQETSDENENEKENMCTENEDVHKVRVEIALTSESSNLEEPGSFQKVEDLGKDNSTLTTCTIEEGTSVDACVKNTDVAEVQLGAISEGTLDHACLSSPASGCNVSQRSVSSIEELQAPDVPTLLGKDIAASSMDCETSNHSNSTVEESMVLVESQGRIKGRSLTLEEATETILFCSSIVHNLAYKAANIAIEKETPLDPSGNNGPGPLVPAVGKGYFGRKDLQNRKTSKRLLRSQKARQRKDTEKAPNSANAGEVTDLTKPQIVFRNNKENTKPPKLESKCNCRIM